MAHTRLLSDNYLDPSVILAATVSSEQSGYEASNCYNFKRRSRVWRSAGYWAITASNGGIVFQEAAGVNLTATIAASNYATTTAFLAAVKTALDAAGDSNYTVALDGATGKIKITSGGGGGRIFSAMWTAVGSTAADVLGFSTASDDTGALTYTADVLRIHTCEWIKWDLGATTNPLAFVMTGQRNIPLRLSPTATIKLEGNDTDVWTSPAYSLTMTYHDYAVAAFSTTGLHTSGLRYWRLYIEDKTNPDLYIEISTLFLGDYVEPARGSVQFPLSAEFLDNTSTTYSESGQSFSDIKQKRERFSLSWYGLTVAEKEEIEDFFEVVGTGLPWFIAMDPDAAFSSHMEKMIRYVKFESPPRWKLESPTNFSLDMELLEEV